MQAVLVGIQDVSGLKCECKEDQAFFEVKWDFDTAVQVRLLTETVGLSLRGIAASYPKFLKIMEVQL